MSDILLQSCLAHPDVPEADWRANNYYRDDTGWTCEIEDGDGNQRTIYIDFEDILCDMAFNIQSSNT